MKQTGQIIRYVHEKKYKVTGINSRIFGRVELVFDNYVDANKCLADTQIGNKEKIVNFYVPRRAMSCKGVVSWDKFSTLDELVDSMESTDNIVEIERMRKRRFDRNTETVIEEKLDLVCVTWEGNRILEQIRIYGRLSGLRVRPFIENVIMCYNCYGFGHFQKHCKSDKKCLICGDQYHGVCDKPIKCCNCEGNHKPIIMIRSAKNTK